MRCHRTVDAVNAKPHVLDPLGASPAAALRAAGGTAYVADSHPGYPGRQCLRDAEIGDELLLVSYDPSTIDSPCRSMSPIFVHTAPCRPDESNELPTPLTSRQLSNRAFNKTAMMVDATLIDGSSLDGTLCRMFADQAVDVGHVHNAVRGCWATRVRRAEPLTRQTEQGV